jgi:signal transduction histidine kinase
MAEAGDTARRRIERDIHDGTQQRLLALLLDLRRIQQQAVSSSPALAGELAATSTDLATAIDELRELAHGIHPAVLTERGLGAALRTLARRAPIPVDLDLHLPHRLPERIETNAYYVIAEAFTNAVKHARATTVRIHAEADPDLLQISVEDDGVGGADPNAGSGIRGLRDRIYALGGSCQLHSPSAHGTTLRCSVPLRSAPDRHEPEGRQTTYCGGRW